MIRISKIAHETSRCPRLRLQVRQNLLQRPVCEGADFVMGAVLDRMQNEYYCGVVAECLALRRRRDLEFRRRDPNRHDAQLLKPSEVMHTARRAGASISQAF